MSNRRIPRTLGEALESQFNVTDFICDYEAGLLDDDQIVEGFQHLIDSGIVWSLQGRYGRTAAGLIEAGHCHLRSNEED